MWHHAEVAALLDREGRLTVVSRNEQEALISNVVGRPIVDMLTPESVPRFKQAFNAALAGEEVEALLSGVADEGFIFWGRVRLMPSPESESPVLLHMRRLPVSWGKLSSREQDVIRVLNETNMNAKRAARQLGISLHTLNSHRRSICQKCDLQGIGDFWVFVQRCR
jgi:DNA-binding CsgD family transcriptional regulator